MKTKTKIPVKAFLKAFSKHPIKISQMIAISLVFNVLIKIDDFFSKKEIKGLVTKKGNVFLLPSVNTKESFVFNSDFNELYSEYDLNKDVDLAEISIKPNKFLPIEMWKVLWNTTPEWKCEFYENKVINKALFQHRSFRVQNGYAKVKCECGSK